jgi:hypothetical protein
MEAGRELGGRGIGPVDVENRPLAVVAVPVPDLADQAFGMVCRRWSMGNRAELDELLVGGPARGQIGEGVVGQGR